MRAKLYPHRPIVLLTGFRVTIRCVMTDSNSRLVYSSDDGRVRPPAGPAARKPGSAGIPALDGLPPDPGDGFVRLHRGKSARGGKSGTLVVGLRGQRLGTRRDPSALQTADGHGRNPPRPRADDPGRPSGEAASAPRGGRARRQTGWWLARLHRITLKRDLGVFSVPKSAPLRWRASATNASTQVHAAEEPWGL